MPDLFAVRPSGAFTERYAYRTDVLTAEDGTEQRRILRVHPVGAFELGFVGRPGKDAQRARRMLEAGQGVDCWAPWWPYAGRLTAGASAGAGTVSAPTADIPFQDPSGLWLPVALWSDPDTWELHEITNATGGVITLTDTLADDWPAGAFVVPVHRGWISPDVAPAWPGFDVLTGRVSIQLEVTGDVTTGPDADPAVPVFTTIPTRPEAIPERLGRRVTTFDPGLGERTSYIEDAAGTRVRSFTYILNGRTAVKAMRDFLDARYGRAVPFRMPSWQRDMTLAADAAAIDTEILIETIGYADHLFSPATSRLYLLSPNGQTALQLVVTDAVDNEDGTETLTLSGAIGTAVTTAWRVMQLRYCRLDADEVEFRWRGTEIATVELPIREIPEPA